MDTKRKRAPRPKKGWGFRPGYDKLPAEKQAEFKAKAMPILRQNTGVGWLNYLDGYRMPDADVYEAMNSLFATYGIRKSQIWEKHNQNTTDEKSKAKMASA